MSRLKFTFLICLFGGLHPVTSQAVIIVPTRDPHDDRDIVHLVANNPHVVAFHREADAFRDRLLGWKERDFRALFGPPVDASKGDEALMLGEPRMLALSGLHSDNPNDNKDHTDAYLVAAEGPLLVYFGHDGKSPVYVLFYLKTDKDFIKLDRAANVEKRLTWEKPRFVRLVMEIDRRWRQAVVWEVDTELEKAQSQDLESGDFTVKLRALERWGKEHGYTLNYHPSEGNVTPTWSWFRGEVLMAEARHDRGFKGNKATPCHFAFCRPDGSLLRDETGWHSLEMIRWYRLDGEALAFVELGTLRDRAWQRAEWSWYNKRGEIVRTEKDSNGDGVPDVYGNNDLADQEPQSSLSVDRSWAVNPGLIPVELRNPGQPGCRLPLRRIPE
jgi:hypothetical protein